MNKASYIYLCKQDLSNVISVMSQIMIEVYDSHQVEISDCGNI